MKKISLVLVSVLILLVSCKNGEEKKVGFPHDFTNVTWLYHNVSEWEETATLSSVTLSGNMIFLDYDKASVWSGVNTAGAFVNANAWIFVKQGDQWFAGTWEWMRHGQTAKQKRAVNGDHIKVNPLSNFKPVTGETYGFMVSGLARTNVRNVHERSNVVMIEWR